MDEQYIYVAELYITGTIGSIVWAFNGAHLVLVHRKHKLLFDSKPGSVVR